MNMEFIRNEIMFKCERDGNNYYRRYYLTRARSSLVLLLVFFLLQCNGKLHNILHYFLFLL